MSICDYVFFIACVVDAVLGGDFRVLGSDNGLGGDYFEARVKMFLGNVRGAIVSPAGRKDTRKAGNSFAIKSGYGSLYSVERDGKPKSREFIGCDYVIWSGDPTADPSTALLVKVADLLACEPLIRKTYGNDQYARHYDENAPKGTKLEEWYDDNDPHDNPLKKNGGKSYKNKVAFVSDKAKVDRLMKKLAVCTLGEFTEMIKK